jgi:hypothetical protein
MEDNSDKDRYFYFFRSTIHARCLALEQYIVVGTEHFKNHLPDLKLGPLLGSKESKASTTARKILKISWVMS